MPQECRSLDENKIVKVSKTVGNDLKKRHAATFTRVYPKGLRFDSSNYSPIPGWEWGAQIVALNYQTTDENMLINQCFYQKN